MNLQASSPRCLTPRSPFQNNIEYMYDCRYIKRKGKLERVPRLSSIPNLGRGCQASSCVDVVLWCFRPSEDTFITVNNLTDSYEGQALTWLRAKSRENLFAAARTSCSTPSQFGFILIPFGPFLSFFPSPCSLSRLLAGGSPHPSPGSRQPRSLFFPSPI